MRRSLFHLQRAHPRSRGENEAEAVHCGCEGGSSPLTRGKRPLRDTRRHRRRLIPAHAGKTPRERCRTRPSPAHPRSRGENLYVSAVPPETAGSSPLTRGKLGQVRGRQAHQRLIPAHAGKTGCRRSAREQPRAHPRSRGENIIYVNNYVNKMGSSPLTRGKQQQPTTRGSRKRLIPAHAGKTDSV